MTTDELLLKLINMCESEQNAALEIPDNAGVRMLSERDKHINRANAFLDVIRLIRNDTQE